jgi:hypothetical protein
MGRIHLCLSIVTGAVLTAAFATGLVSQLRDGLNHPHDPIFMTHFTLGLFAVFLVLAVHCLIFIYLLGTGRWVKEVAEAYRLPDDPLPKLTRDLKRRTFPPALFAMLIGIATAAAGAGAQSRSWPWHFHFGLAVVTLLINLWAFRVEARNIRINVGVIDDVMREVERIRAERGLPTSEEALREMK